MADYYTKEVLTAPVYLTKDLVTILNMKGAEVYPSGKEASVLDGIVTGELLEEYYVTFEEGWSEYYETFTEYADERLDEEEEAEVSDFVKEKFNIEKEDLMLEILKVNPDKEELEMQSSWSCSRMRLDGFGGSGLIVNRKGYLYLTTSNWEVDADGTIRNRCKFTPWESEQGDNSEAA